MQVWLQEFAWTEADKPIKLAARSSMVPNDAELGRQPMFCFETMMKLLYWSCFVYDHMRVCTHFLLVATLRECLDACLVDVAVQAALVLARAPAVLVTLLWLTPALVLCCISALLSRTAQHPYHKGILHHDRARLFSILTSSCLPLMYLVAHPFVLHFLTVRIKRPCTPLKSSRYRQKVNFSPGSCTYVLLQEQLTPRHGLKKACSEQQPIQQIPEHTPQQTPRHNPQQGKLGGTSFTARTTLTLHTALSLYNMTECQSFWETEQDTRCLIGWGSSTVVVAFRGTASMKNALADLQVCPAALLSVKSSSQQAETTSDWSSCTGAICLNEAGVASAWHTLYKLPWGSCCSQATPTSTLLPPWCQATGQVVPGGAVSGPLVS